MSQGYRRKYLLYTEVLIKQRAFVDRLKTEDVQIWQKDCFESLGQLFVSPGSGLWASPGRGRWASGAVLGAEVPRGREASPSTGTVLRQPLSSFRPQPARGGCPRHRGHLSTPMARPAGPLLTQPLVAFIATGEPPFWFHPELCCLCSSSLSPALSLGTGEAETNHDQRRNDCHCKNVFINDLHIILWEWYPARQNCDRFSPNGNISLQKCVALKGVKKLNVFPPVRKMTDQGQETIH